MKASRAKGVVVYPQCPLQLWYTELELWSKTIFYLPSPYTCVRPYHPGKLLSVKGTLVTVVCDGLTRQRVFDTLAKYNVLKIGTPGSTHITQRLTLPILHSLDVNTPGLQSINHLFQQARRPRTKQPS